MKRIRVSLKALSLFLVLAAASSTTPAQNADNAAKSQTAKEAKIDPKVAAISISVNAAAKLLVDSNNVVPLDVRTEKEFAAGHLPNARNISSRAEDFKEQLARLDRNKTILFYSTGGGTRAAKTVETLESLGFKKYANLEGGYNAWTNAAQVVVK